MTAVAANTPVTPRPPVLDPAQLSDVSVIFNKPGAPDQAKSVTVRIGSPGNKPRSFFTVNENNHIGDTRLIERFWAPPAGVSTTPKQVAAMDAFRGAVLASGLTKLVPNPSDGTDAKPDSTMIFLTFSPPGSDRDGPQPPTSNPTILSYWAPSLKEAPQAFRDVVAAAEQLGEVVKPTVKPITYYPWDRP